MPEVIEAELYRAAAEQIVGRTVTGVLAPDSWYLKRGTTADELDAVLVGSEFSRTRRHGKIVLLDVHGGPTLGLRFGMTGRLIVDERAPIEKLEYASGRGDPAWNRFGLLFGAGSLVISDPRRLGGVELEPDLTRLGPDAWEITSAELIGALAGSRAALKARLLDQSRLAGLGNLLCDEILWRVGLPPDAEARALDAVAVDRLATAIRATIADLAERGGSHTGDLHDQRHRDGVCPRDGTPLTRVTIGGRTTYACPLHQCL